MKKKVKLYPWHIAIADYLARNKDRAQAIIEAAFPGHRIAKIRKDAGTTKPKIPHVSLAEVREVLDAGTTKKREGENHE